MARIARKARRTIIVIVDSYYLTDKKLEILQGDVDYLLAGAFIQLEVGQRNLLAPWMFLLQGPKGRTCLPQIQ